MPADIRSKVVAAYSSEWSYDRALEEQRKDEPPLSPALSRQARDIAKTRPRLFSSPPEAPPEASPGLRLVRESEPVRFPNGAVLHVRVANEGDTEAAPRVGPAYWALVESKTDSARRTLVLSMALMWLIPCLALYAIAGRSRGCGAASAAAQPARVSVSKRERVVDP
jgi:hypothetical protein